MISIRWSVAVALLVQTTTGCDGIDLERMLDQNKAEAYEESPFFADGRAMQLPPEGTVPRHAVIGPKSLVAGVDQGEYVTRIPVPVNMELLERGQNRFRIFCRTCHGPLGTGKSQVAENMSLRPPPSLHEPRIVEYPAGRLYRVIRDGYGLMPSYANELGLSDRWAVVAYVQALQLSQRLALAELPRSMQEEARSWLK